jgi:biopolymer transport protein TolR
VDEVDLEEKKQELMSDINVTPLVDVMLVLLIIFMATAPMMRQGVKVKLNAKLKKIFLRRKEKEILLEADKDVPYGFVIKVMSQVKAAGITKVGMITEPLHK